MKKKVDIYPGMGHLNRRQKAKKIKELQRISKDNAYLEKMCKSTFVLVERGW